MAAEKISNRLRPSLSLRAPEARAPFELLDAFQLRVHAAARARVAFAFFTGLALGSSKSATAMAVVIGR